MNKTTLLSLGLATALIVAGCGGGGGGAVGGGAVSLGVFVTDDFTTDYRQVWGGVCRIDLIAQDGSSVNVYDKSSGAVFDFNSLHDGTGSIFAFLNQVSVPNKPYSKAKIYVEPSMTLVPAAGGATTASFDDSLPRTTDGKVEIEIQFSTPKSFSSSDDFVVDFDLSQFTVVGGKIRPKLKEGSKSGLDDSARHVSHELEGTMSGLAGIAPTQTFNVTRGTSVVAVRTSANTVIFNSDGTSSPSLGDGKHVNIHGTFDPVNNVFNAATIRLRPAGAEDHPHEMHATVNTFDTTAGTINASLIFSSGIIPSSSSINVTMTSNAFYRGDSGISLTKAEFFARLAANSQVEFEGTYSNGSFTASKAKLEHEGGDDNPGGGGGSNGSESEAKGKPISVNASAGTLTINPVSEFEGFVLGSGGVQVTTSTTTEYEDQNGESIDKATFFSAASTIGRVKVNGFFREGVIVARRLRLVS